MTEIITKAPRQNFKSAIVALNSPITRIHSEEGTSDVWTAYHPTRAMCVVTPFHGTSWKENRMWCALIDGTDAKYGLHRTFLKNHIYNNVVFWEVPAHPCYIQVGQKGISGSGIYYYVNPEGDLELADVVDVLLIMKSISGKEQDLLPEADDIANERTPYI